MPLTNFMFTSESVTEGHPDKIADQISDAILDDLISQDKKSRVAAETLVTTGMCLVAGEITTEGYCDIPAVVRETIKGIGYNDSSMGFDWETCAVLTSIDRQSPDISIGVSEGEGLHKEQGAGDQGLMFGYACDDTPEFMPMPIVFAHNITRGLADARREGLLPFLRPDGKSQVTIEYVDASPKKINTVVVSTQHSPDVTHETIRGRRDRRGRQEGVAQEALERGRDLSHQPDGSIRGGRASCGLRRDGQEDHRGHVRGTGKPWRRRLFREGSLEGGPKCFLHGPVHREEHHRGGPREAL